MTLTVVIGSSGSGKTTFLNDVHKSHKCTYIRQYHNMRPYITVSKIPNFDPTRLPYWDIYEREKKADTIKAGGTLAGKFTAGLSGGQRKLLLFELICQRTAGQSELLIALDEPFAGVTDDFVPFIIERLNAIRAKHNILLVTNDHVATLTELADNILVVSAIDRAVVRVNNRQSVKREHAINALSLGDEYVYTASGMDLKFFWDVEVYKNGNLMGVAIFVLFCESLFLLTFHNSREESQALVLVASGVVTFFSVNPYLLSLVEWRNAMLEEAEALVHASKGLNKLLKLLLTVSLVVIVASLQFGVVNASINGLESGKFWVGMVFDSCSITFSMMCIALFTRLPFQAAQILGSFPFLMLIFFSTTFSPGAGVEGVSNLRYLFSRYYLWCMVPAVRGYMEGCPSDQWLVLCLVLSANFFVFIFVVIKLIFRFRKATKHEQNMKKRQSMMEECGYKELQVELYGEKVLRRLKKNGSDVSLLEKSLNGVEAVEVKPQKESPADENPKEEP